MGLDALRWVVRRCVRGVLFVSPSGVRRLMERVPFSRYHRLMACVRGRERISWRGAQLEVDPGTIEGFYLFFLRRSMACPSGELDAIVELCKGASVFFDVGANAGIVSLAVAAAHRDIRVVSFEPDAAAASRLRRNIEVNPDLASRVLLVEKVVTDHDGFVRFFPGPPGGSELSSVFAGQGVSAQVPCLRLDSYCADTNCYPDVVKVDVEAAEGEVLAGMRTLPSGRWPRALFVEVHGSLHPDGPAALSTRVYQALVEQRYRLFELRGAEEVPCRAPDSWGARTHIVACGQLPWNQ